MASDDTMTILHLHSPTVQLEDVNGIDDGNNEEDHHHHHTPCSHCLSRLTMCITSSSGSKPPNLTTYMYDDDDDDDDDDVGGGGDDITDMGIDMARSIDCSSEGDVDEGLLDGKEGRDKGVTAGMSSDSDKETDCYSLPATPSSRRRRARPCEYGSGNLLAMGLREYASENEAQRRRTTARRRSSSRRPTTACCWSSPSSSSSSWTRKRLAGPGMGGRDRWGLGLEMEREWDENDQHKKYGNVKAEEEADRGSECMVITRPKGGRRSLCMDMEEVKACRDLGFELDHERMMMTMMDTPTPSRVSISMSAASTIDFDTSSGGNSPIANWRISSPGDDPRDVKARLKVWAQAVAVASTSFSTR